MDLKNVCTSISTPKKQAPCWPNDYIFDFNFVQPTFIQVASLFIFEYPANILYPKSRLC